MRLTGKGIDFRALQAGREIEFELDAGQDDDFYNYEDESDQAIDYEKVFKYRNVDMLNCGEEEADEAAGDETRDEAERKNLCTPFERLREKMEPVTADGGVVKRVLEAGAGVVIPAGSRVRSRTSRSI